MSQMRALVSLPKNWGTNPGWSDWSWSTETPSIHYDFFPSVLHFRGLVVPNTHNAKKSHNPSGLEITLGGRQFVLGKKLILDLSVLLVIPGFEFLLQRWKEFWKHYVLIFLFSEILGFIKIIRQWNLILCDVWYIYWFEKVLTD